MKWWPFGKRKKRKTMTQRGFDGVSTGRLFSTWMSGESSFNQSVQMSLAKLRERSRDHEINNPYGKRWIKLYKNHIVGEKGVRVVSNVLDRNGNTREKQNSQVERHFNDLWARKGSCDVTGRFSWIDIQEQVVGCYKRDGEAFVRLVTLKGVNDYGFALQLIKPDLLDENLNVRLDNGHEIKMGIEHDEWERRVAYYFKTDSNKNYTILGNTKYLRLNADEVLHVFNAIRPEQLRGVPELHTAISSLKMLAGYQEAELVAARLGAAKAGFFKKTQSDAEAFIGDEEHPGRRSGDQIARDPFGNVSMEVSPGQYQRLPVGWDFEPYDPKHPTDAFEPFVRSTLMSVSSAMNISYATLANDYSSVNYSSLRASILVEQDVYKAEQRFLIDHLVRPVYQKWLWHAVANSKVDISTKEITEFLEPEFQARRWQWVDPAKEAQANKIAVDNGFKSLSEVAAERGRALEDILKERKRELELMKQLGLKQAESEEGLDIEKDDRSARRGTACLAPV